MWSRHDMGTPLTIIRTDYAFRSYHSGFNLVIKGRVPLSCLFHIVCTPACHRWRRWRHQIHCSLLFSPPPLSHLKLVLISSHSHNQLHQVANENRIEEKPSTCHFDYISKTLQSTLINPTKKHKSPLITHHHRHHHHHHPPHPASTSAAIQSHHQHHSSNYPVSTD